MVQETIKIKYNMLIFEKNAPMVLLHFCPITV